MGGLHDAVNTYVKEHNIVKVRDVHRGILELYGLDASKYEKESSRKLKILRIYEMIPSNLENKKKRVKVKDIEGKKVNEPVTIGTSSTTLCLPGSRWRWMP